MIAFDCTLHRGDFALAAAFEADAGTIGLFGPSGSGKSTVLRLIAGLEAPERGKITLGDTIVLDTERGISMAVHKRRIGFVFQDAQLFPHLSVRENLTYGQRFAKNCGPGVSFATTVDVLGIGHLLDRKPETLSGGERQRVAIGRALLASPRILLFDEPLASLDSARKLEILALIEEVRDAFKLPTVYVSHAAEEVARLATSVVKLADGKVVAQGPPADVLAPVAFDAVSDRFDALSMITARVVREDRDYAVTVLAHPAGTIVVPGLIASGHKALRVAIRATNVVLALDKPVGLSVRTVLEGQVSSIEEDRSPFARVCVGLNGGDFLYAFTTRIAVAELGLGVGTRVFALAKTVAIDERGVAGL